MSVSSFDPNAASQPVDAAQVAQMVQFAHKCAAAMLVEGQQAADTAALDGLAAQADQFTALATHSGWSEQAQSLADADIVALIQVFTVGEERFAGWLAGDKSPVVPLVRVLKSRGSFDTDLSRWIKTHSNNKFLPHGSLMDRL